MKYNSIIFVMCLIGLACQVNVLAQEEINQDVKVVKAYTPTVSDAFKISYMPVLDDSTSYNPKFNYRILSASVATNYQPTSLSPAKINTKRKEHLQKSYLKGGVGNYSTILGELGYNILENEKYLLGLNVGHLSSIGNITLENDKTVDAPFFDTWATADFKHFFDNKTLDVNFGFTHNKYEYYGFQTLDEGGVYWKPNETGSFISGADLMPDVQQRISAFDASIGISNNETDERKTKYTASAGLDVFGSKTGVSQIGFIVNGSLYRPINDLALDVKAEIKTYGTSVPDTLGPMYEFNDRSQTLIKLNPSINFNYDRARLKVGMLIAGVIDTEGDEFYLTPDVVGELTVVEGIATIYGGITGRVNLNDYRSMLYENRFASSDINVKSSVYGLNFMAGIKGNFSASTSFSAGVEYGFFNNEHFWVNRNYVRQTEGPEMLTEQHYSNLYDVVYDDGSLLTVNGELLYKPKPKIEFALNGVFYGWNLDSQEAAWHMPEVEFGLEGKFNLLENLFTSAEIRYLGERVVQDLSNADIEKTLDGVIDVNINAEFYFSKQWSFWASVNNLTASKYYKWNGYPMQGLNAKAGIVFSF